MCVLWNIRSGVVGAVLSLLSLSQGFGSPIFELRDVPLPAEVTSAFSSRRCLSPQGAVTGEWKDSSNQDRTYYWDGISPEVTSLTGFTSAFGITSQSHIICGVNGSSNAASVALWRPVGAPIPLSGYSGVPTAFNDQDAITLRPSTSSFPQSVWQAGTLRLLKGRNNSEFNVVGIHNDGTVFGADYSSYANACLWREGVASGVSLQALTTGVSESFVRSLNTHGDLAGDISFVTGNTWHTHAFVRLRNADHSYDVREIREAGQPAFDWATVTEINEQGQVIGNFRRSNQVPENRLLGFVWQRDATTGVATFVELPTLGGAECYAWDINNHGDIIGWARDAQGVKEPALWQRDAAGVYTVCQLNAQIPAHLGWRLGDVVALNDLGHIAGTALRDGQSRAVLLQPLLDTDQDELPDAWESAHGLDPASPADATLDDDEGQGDGLQALGEYHAGTDPRQRDTDGDGLPDGWEDQHGYDPTDPADAAWDLDHDGLTTWQEFQVGTDPHPHYQLVDLGRPNHEYYSGYTFPYTPTGLNDQREIAATWSWPLGDGEWDTHAYRFTLSTSQPPQAILSDQIFSFTTDDGGGYTEYERERVSGINAAGQIVGSAGIDNAHWAAFRWQAGTKKLIHAPHWFYSYGSAISHLGHIAGFFQSAAHQWRVLPFLWEEDGTPSGEFHEIGLQNFNVGFSYGFTATGRLFGSYQDRVLWRYRGFIWDQGQISYPSVTGMADLDLIALNDRGDLLARTWSPSYYAFSDFPFLLRAGATTPLRLGTLGGAHAVARAMNESGQIIGKSLTRSGIYHAFVWKEGRMLDLNSLTNLTVPGSSATWEITDALSLNTRGDIGGVATRWNAPPTGPEERGVILLATIRDTDGDGMSDDWETYHGLDPSLATDAAADPDGDGLSNLEEYQMSFNPLDYASGSPILSIIQGGNQLGEANSWSDPIVLQVVDAKGRTLANASVQLDLPSGSGGLSVSQGGSEHLHLNVTSLPNGTVSFFSRLPNSIFAKQEILSSTGSFAMKVVNGTVAAYSPTDPQDLEAVQMEDQLILLKWLSPSLPGAGIRISRKTDETPWVELALIPPSQTEYEDRSVEPNKLYYYEVNGY